MLNGYRLVARYRGGVSVRKPGKARPLSFLRFEILAAACALLLAVTTVILAHAPAAARQAGAENAGNGKVIGVALDGRMVSNLDKSVAFYKALGFVPVEGVNSAWRNDGVFNRIHGTKGVESRMAKFTLDSNISGKPFTLYLREFRGIKRRNVMRGKAAWEPGAAHIDLTVTDARALWSKLKAAGMLWPRSWGGKLVPLPGQTKYTMAYITDPDGMDVEIVDQRPAMPATATQPARPADPPGFNHIGLVVLDSIKAKAFYGGLLGEQFPKTESAWLSNDFMDSAVGGHGNVLRIFNGTFAEAADRNARMRFEVVEYKNRKKPVAPYSITDIGVNYIGFEVSGIDAFVTRLKKAGVKVVSDGIVTMNGGYRVALVRDPDVGAFVELFERPRK
jgi:catechol 2,3-dioxygenase-like lactoylglutathione lyase family enzyme